jgi:hypothetical protein
MIILYTSVCNEQNYSKKCITLTRQVFFFNTTLYICQSILKDLSRAHRVYLIIIAGWRIWGSSEAWIQEPYIYIYIYKKKAKDSSTMFQQVICKCSTTIPRIRCDWMSTFYLILILILDGVKYFLPLHESSKSHFMSDFYVFLKVQYITQLYHNGFSNKFIYFVSIFRFSNLNILLFFWDVSKYI